MESGKQEGRTELRNRYAPAPYRDRRARYRLKSHPVNSTPIYPCNNQAGAELATNREWRIRE
jgi:hypothetical protein